jgi:hypothetical protein
MPVVMIFNHRGRNMVWPPCVLVKPGDEVIFKVAAPGSRLYFPEREVFKETCTRGMTAVGRGVMVNLGADGTALTVRSQGALQKMSGKAKKQEENLPRVYPYSVYCACGNDFAEGNSSPVLIIEPPDPPPMNTVVNEDLVRLYSPKKKK